MFGFIYYSISTLFGYLMANPVSVYIYIYIYIYMIIFDLLGVMVDRDGWRERERVGKSVLLVRLDDDDDDDIICK